MTRRTLQSQQQGVLLMSLQSAKKHTNQQAFWTSHQANNWPPIGSRVITFALHTSYIFPHS